MLSNLPELQWLISYGDGSKEGSSISTVHALKHSTLCFYLTEEEYKKLNDFIKATANRQ